MPSSNVPWEAGCGPADPALSASFATYQGSGYNPIRGGTGKVGTINAGLGVALPPPSGFPAQVRWFVGFDGQLHALTNQTGVDYAIPAGASPQQPPVYSPTK